MLGPTRCPCRVADGAPSFPTFDRATAFQMLINIKAVHQKRKKDDDDDVYYSKGGRPREGEEGEESYEKQRQWRKKKWADVR